MLIVLHFSPVSKESILLHKSKTLSIIVECCYADSRVLFVVMVIVIMLSVIMLSVVKLSVIMLSVIMLSVIMFCVIMLIVVIC